MYKSGVAILIVIAMMLIGGCDAVTNNQLSMFDNQEQQKGSGDSYTFRNTQGQITDGSGDANFSGFSGLYTVLYITATEDVTTKISISGKISSGKFKLIQVNGENDPITLWEGGEDRYISISFPQGKSVLKWVGQKAAGKINITLEPHEGLTYQHPTR